MRRHPERQTSPDVSKALSAGGPASLRILSRRDVAAQAGLGMVYKLNGSVDSGGHAIDVSVDAKGDRHVLFFEGRHQTADVNAGAIEFPLAVDAVSGTAVFENTSANGSIFNPG